MLARVGRFPVSSHATSHDQAPTPFSYQAWPYPFRHTPSMISYSRHYYVQPPIISTVLQHSPSPPSYCVPSVHTISAYPAIPHPQPLQPNRPFDLNANLI